MLPNPGPETGLFQRIPNAELARPIGVNVDRHCRVFARAAPSVSITRCGRVGCGAPCSPSPARRSFVPHHTKPAAVRRAISLIQTAAKSAQERSERPIIANSACLSGKGVSDTSSGGHITRNTLLTYDCESLSYYITYCTTIPRSILINVKEKMLNLR